jgi:predicted nicotinamide N-methyase
MIEHLLDLDGLSLRLLAAQEQEPPIDDLTDPDRIPYWSVLWDSSLVLAQWIHREGGWTDLPVLELGCGTGLVGIAAAACGARVVQTDLFPEAAELAASNARLNCVRTRGVAADWRHWPLRGRWPGILAADVLYERRTHAALLDVMAASLAPGGTVHLADPSRPMSAAFFTLAQGRGWICSREHRCHERDHDAIALYRLKLRGF